MYCPKCSQQQASEQARFCSRCGFRMDAVAELLAADGVLEQNESGPRWKKISLRKAGLRLWALMMVFMIGITPLMLATGNKPDVMVTFALTAGIFFAGIFWMLYFRLFEREELPPRKTKQPREAVAPRKAALSPMPQTVTAGAASQRVNTADMLQPPSVTESTTNLLES